MNKVLIVIMFILLGTSLIVVSNMGKGVQNSFVIEYQNNKNLALPDLIGKEAIAPNVFRLYNNNGVVIDYNVYNGIYTINGTATAEFGYNHIFNNEIVNTQGDTDFRMYRIDIQNKPNEFIIYVTDILTNTQLVSLYSTKTLGAFYTQPNQDNVIGIYVYNGMVFNNYQFKIQIEKGTTVSAYVVPKLIPVYKDNLTQQEKNDIGLGAFGGITKIIKTISDIIKPVGDFVNGLLNIF